MATRSPGGPGVSPSETKVCVFVWGGSLVNKATYLIIKPKVTEQPPDVLTVVTSFMVKSLKLICDVSSPYSFFDQWLCNMLLNIYFVYNFVTETDVIKKI